MSHRYLLVTQPNQGVCELTLNRPEKHNALNSQLIAELTEAITESQNNAAIRVILLTARGTNFCAGADLNEMREARNWSKEKNVQHAQALSDLFHTISQSAKPIVAVVQGKTYGGGIGLLAATDYVIADAGASFALPEVKWGLVAATIAPYLVRTMGDSACRRYLLSGEVFDSQTAQHHQLVHKVITAGDDLVKNGLQVAEQISRHGSDALATTKQLLNQLSPITKETQQYCAQLLADIRVSAEVKQRLSD